MNSKKSAAPVMGTIHRGMPMYRVVLCGQVEFDTLSDREYTPHLPIVTCASCIQIEKELRAKPGKPLPKSRTRRIIDTLGMGEPVNLEEIWNSDYE
jgi:hypothetical protein